LDSASVYGIDLPPIIGSRAAGNDQVDSEGVGTTEMVDFFTASYVWVELALVAAQDTHEECPYKARRLPQNSYTQGGADVADT
jgi:hypothetical protein